MKSTPVRILAAVIFSFPLFLQAQTWVGGSGGNVFNVTANWSPASVPLANADLVFNTTTNTFVGFNTLPYTANSITFGSAATNQFFINGNGSTLTLNSGVTTLSGNGGANFSTGVNIAFGGNQTWNTASTVSVAGNTSGAFSLTKTGTGSLVLSGSNSYTGGTTVNGGALYLGNTNSSTGTVTVGASGTLGGAFGDLTIANNVTLASGATVGGTSGGGGGGEIQFTGTVTVADPSATLSVAANSNAYFGGTLSAASSTALTVQSNGTGIAIMAGTLNNITTLTADNAAIAFGNSASMPTAIQATNGGYVSVVDLAGASPVTPADTAVLTRIVNRGSFNGTLGFDTDDNATSPHDYSSAIDLSAAGTDTSLFLNGNIRIGSATSAVLSGAITPVAQSFDFGGYAGSGGFLGIKSVLADHGGATGLTVVSPSASGGAPQNGFVLGLLANNTFTGNVTVSYSSLLLDSTTALPTGSTIALGAYSYAGYTEATGYSFSGFLGKIASATATSIIGIDSHDVIDQFVNGGTGTSVHTLSTGTIDLSGYSSVYLGTMTGATIDSGVSIVTPTDTVLRLVNLGDKNSLTINPILSNSGGLVVGMAGSEGTVTLNGVNTYGTGTTLLGGGLLVGNPSALSSGLLTVTNSGTGPDLVLAAATNNITVGNNIAVTGNFNIGNGGLDDTGTTFTAGTNLLNLTGAISGSGRLYLTGPTSLSGTNSYTGGTYVEAATTVTNNSALGTGFVDLGYNAVLTVDTPHLSIGSLANAGNFIGGAGTGNINFTANALDLTINQTSNLSYSGLFTGSAANLIKTGSGQLTLLGANGSSIASTAINGGSVAIGDGANTTVAFGGNVSIAATGAGTGLFLRPGGAQTLSYGGNITGAGTVTINGASNGTVSITGGTSSFTGNTSINSGTLRITGDNFWSSTSATTVGAGTTLRLDGNQTLKNLTGAGTVNLFTSGKTLTVDSVGATTFTGTITGSGGLTKAGSSSFTVSGTNSFTGNTTVSAGTLIINSAFASPTVTVNSGAFLLGTGTLNDVVLNGSYSPGLSGAAGSATLDSLTMSGTGILTMQLGGTTQGTTYDFLNVSNATGSGAFSAGGTLAVTFINSFAPASGNTFNLFDFTSMSGTFTTLNLGSLTSGLSWDTSALYTTGVLSVTGTAIPEPATSAAFAGLGMLALAAWRRRAAKRASVEVAARF